MAAANQKATAPNIALSVRVIRYLRTGTVQALIIGIKWHHIKVI